MSKFSSKTKPAAPEAKPAASKPKNVTVLDIRMQQMKDGSKKPKVQFAKDITISYQGTPLDLGEYNSAFLKDRAELEADLEFLVGKDYMNEEQANAEVDRIEEKGIQYVFKAKLS